MNQDDKKSPLRLSAWLQHLPATVRGGGIGGRLYFSENKYQVTFVLGHGASTDFFGTDDNGKVTILFP